MPKVIGSRKWVHKSALSTLTGGERRQVKRLADRVCDFDWQVARVGGGSVMLGRTTSWDDLHPELLESVTLSGGTLKRRRYTNDPPVYHRVEQMLLPTDPRARRASAATRRQEAAGLLGRSDIGRRSSWARARGDANRRHAYEYWLACTDLSRGELIWYITGEHEREITYATFAKHVNLAPLREQDHPAMWRISAPDNWAISFYQSELPNGERIYFFAWSGIEHIFVDPSDGWPDKESMEKLAVSWYDLL